MYLIITNMEKQETPLDNHVFCVIAHCKANQYSDIINGELSFYYAMYNHKHIKVATFKDHEFQKSNEYNLLNKHRKDLYNVYRFANYGGKDFNWGNLLSSALPLNERLLNNKELQEKIEWYSNNKWINELNW